MESGYVPQVVSNEQYIPSCSNVCVLFAWLNDLVNANCVQLKRVATYRDGIATNCIEDESKGYLPTSPCLYPFDSARGEQSKIQEKNAVKPVFQDTLKNMLARPRQLTTAARGVGMVMGPAEVACRAHAHRTR